jgi:DNA invertase Pin-like site-specific DNA recombinase
MSSIIGYARVSTMDQNPELQLQALQGAGCARIFTDHASGMKEDRPQLKACMEYLREGDTLVVWKLDRLGRSTLHLIGMLKEFQNRGVTFKSLTESFDASTPMGMAVFTFLSAIAQMERDVLIERTKAGLKVARANGKQPGPKKTLTRTQVQHIRILLNDPNTTLADISEQYGVHRTTIYRALKNDLGASQSRSS